MLVGDKKFASQTAAHYGLAVALACNRDWSGAEQETAARKQKTPSPLLDHLHADIRIAQGDADGGLAMPLPRGDGALPSIRPSFTATAKPSPDSGAFADAPQFAETQLQLYPEDVRLHKLRAESYAPAWASGAAPRPGGGLRPAGQTRRRSSNCNWRRRRGDAISTKCR